MATARARGKSKPKWHSRITHESRQNHIKIASKRRFFSSDEDEGSRESDFPRALPTDLMPFQLATSPRWMEENAQVQNGFTRSLLPVCALKREKLGIVDTPILRLPLVKSASPRPIENETKNETKSPTAVKNEYLRRHEGSAPSPYLAMVYGYEVNPRALPQQRPSSPDGSESERSSYSDASTNNSHANLHAPSSPSTASPRRAQQLSRAVSVTLKQGSQTRTREEAMATWNALRSENGVPPLGA